MLWLSLGAKLAWGWLSGNGASVLGDIYAKYKDSDLAHERLQAEWAKNKLDAMLQVRMASINFPEMRVATAAIAFMFISHLGAVWLDTMFQWTWNGLPVSKWPAPMDEWEGAIILSFFGLTAGVKVANGVFGAITEWFKSKK